MGFKNRWPGSDDEEDHRPQPHELKYRHAVRQIERKANRALAPEIAAPKRTRPEIARRPLADRSRRDPDNRPYKTMTRATKELLCDYPGLKLDTLIARLERQGYEAAPMTIALIRRDFLDTIKVATEMGYIRIMDPD